MFLRILGRRFQSTNAFSEAQKDYIRDEIAYCKAEETMGFRGGVAIAACGLWAFLMTTYVWGMKEEMHAMRENIFHLEDAVNEKAARAKERREPREII
jgi:hypothetical protein